MMVSHEFNSMSEFLEHADRPSQSTRGNTSRDDYRGDWSGSDTFEQAKALVFRWDKGAERIERIRARIALPSQRLRKQAVRREAGPGVVSMGAYVQGHPQPYVALVDSERMAKGKGKVVRIYVNLSCSGVVDPEIIETRGAAVLSLVAALEQTGRRCEVYSVFAVTHSGNKLEYRVRVKRAEQKLNLHSIAFALAHPSMLRRVIFAAMESEDKSSSRWGAGGTYGMPADLDVPKDGIYCGRLYGGDRQWQSEATAREWVMDELRKQGAIA